MKKLLTALISTAVLAMPLAVVSTPVSAAGSVDMKNAVKVEAAKKGKTKPKSKSKSKSTAKPKK